MRLFVFGASGGTGAQVVAQALDAGHRVTALARDPSSVSASVPASVPGRDRLTVVRGDVLEPGGWAGAVAGHDAVLSCLGSAGRGPTTVYSRGMDGIVGAMRDGGVRRLLCVTSASLGLAAGASLSRRVLIGWVVRPVYRHLYADMARMEGIVAGSGLDWTVVRPPRLSDGGFSGEYRVVSGREVGRNRSLSRADLAHFMLGRVNDRDTWGATVELSRS
ncbi:MAG: NAD(P)H-binding protein [Nonomuraea sp.]|nr:NAD(P)H-binding protein [Nonomuraea sp.]